MGPGGKSDLDEIMKKYSINTQISNKKISMNPFVLKSFGNVIIALISDLRDVKKEEEINEISLDIDTNKPKNDSLILEVNGIGIDVKDFVQSMITNTILGFFNSLKDIPDEISNSIIKINCEVMNE